MWKELDSKSSTCQSHSERIFSFPYNGVAALACLSHSNCLKGCLGMKVATFRTNFLLCNVSKQAGKGNGKRA